MTVKIHTHKPEYSIESLKNENEIQEDEKKGNLRRVF